MTAVEIMRKYRDEHSTHEKYKELAKIVDIRVIREGDKNLEPVIRDMTKRIKIGVYLIKALKAGMNVGYYKEGEEERGLIHGLYLNSEGLLLARRDDDTDEADVMPGLYKDGWLLGLYGSAGLLFYTWLLNNDIDKENITYDINAVDYSSDNFDDWFEDRLELYNDEQMIKMQEDIFFDYLGTYYDEAISLLVAIENIDIKECKDMIKERLHNGNPASIKTFECMTGIKLDKSHKRRLVQLDGINKSDFKGRVEYKAKKLDREYSTEYYMRMNGKSGGTEWRKAYGKVVNIEGIDIAISKNERNKERNFSATEFRSGLAITNVIYGEYSDIIDEIENVIKRTGLEKIKSMIDKAVKDGGYSPAVKSEN